MLTIATREQNLTVVEVKCPFPFVDNKQAGYYTYVACKQHGTLPARIFAQCQFQMLVAGTPACVLVEWHVTAEQALVIALDPAWCRCTQRLLEVRESQRCLASF
jgi:hypothetical protein